MQPYFYSKAHPHADPDILSTDNEAFRKCFSNPRNLNTPALHFSVDGNILRWGFLKTTSRVLRFQISFPKYLEQIRILALFRLTLHPKSFLTV